MSDDQTQPASETQAASELRRRVAEPATFADGVDAFFRLLRHPELTWRDLLDGLSHPGLIAEQSFLRLHNLLKVPVQSGEFIEDEATWRGMLAQRGVREEDRVPRESPHA